MCEICVTILLQARYKYVYKQIRYALFLNDLQNRFKWQLKIQEINDKYLLLLSIIVLVCSNGSKLLTGADW